MKVTITLNGIPYTREVAGDLMLLDFVRAVRLPQREAGL